MDLFHGSSREVVRVNSAGELIPIEGSKNLCVDGAVLEGTVKTTWRFR